MVRGEELGLAPIKCQNKEGTEELKKIHYDINDIFYMYKKKYISAFAGRKLYTELVTIGKSLAGLVVPAKAQAKKDELLTKLRATVLTLKHYANDYKWQSGDEKQIQATINWEMKRLLDAKKDHELWNNPIQYLEEIKEIRELYIIPFPGKVLYGYLEEFNNEILEMINKKYSIIPS